MGRRTLEVVRVALLFLSSSLGTERWVSCLGQGGCGRCEAGSDPSPFSVCLFLTPDCFQQCPSPPPTQSSHPPCGARIQRAPLPVPHPPPCRVTGPTPHPHPVTAGGMGPRGCCLSRYETPEQHWRENPHSLTLPPGPDRMGVPAVSPSTLFLPSLGLTLSSPSSRFLVLPRGSMPATHLTWAN